MIITPNRSGLQNLQNVSSQFKALQTAADKGSTSEAVVPQDSGDSLFTRLGSMIESYSSKLSDLQDQITRSQTAQDGLDSVSSSLGELKELFSSGESVESGRVSDLLDGIDEALGNATFDGKALLSDMSRSSLGLDGLAEDPSGAMQKLDQAMASVQEKSNQVSSELKSMESELAGIEIGRQNMASADVTIRDASFATNLLSLTAEKIGSHEVSGLFTDSINVDKVLDLLS